MTGSFDPEDDCGAELVAGAPRLRVEDVLLQEREVRSHRRVIVAPAPARPSPEPDPSLDTPNGAPHKVLAPGIVASVEATTDLHRYKGRYCLHSVPSELIGLPSSRDR